MHTNYPILLPPRTKRSRRRCLTCRPSTRLILGLWTSFLLKLQSHYSHQQNPCAPRLFTTSAVGINLQLVVIAPRVGKMACVYYRAKPTSASTSSWGDSPLRRKSPPLSKSTTSLQGRNSSLRSGYMPMYIRSHLILPAPLMSYWAKGISTTPLYISAIGESGFGAVVMRVWCTYLLICIGMVSFALGTRL